MTLYETTVLVMVGEMGKHCTWLSVIAGWLSHSSFFLTILHPQICMLLIVRRLLAFCTAFYGWRQTCRVGLEGGSFISLTHVSSLKIRPEICHNYLFTFFSSSLSPPLDSWTRPTESESPTCISQGFRFCKHSHNTNVVRPALVLWTSLEVSSVFRGYKTGPAFCECIWRILGDFKDLQISPLSLSWFLKYIWQWRKPFNLHQKKIFFFFFSFSIFKM